MSDRKFRKNENMINYEKTELNSLHLYKNIDPDDADWVISEFWFLTPH
jgi:hypothetical protein